MRKLLALFITVAMVALCGCSDDGPQPGGGGDSLGLTCNVSEIDQQARYHTLRIAGVPTEQGNFLTAIDADWARLETDTVPADGIIELWVDGNNEVQRRRLSLTITSEADPALCGTIEIEQKGVGEDGDNADADMLSDFRIGWGMNAYDEYQSSSSIRGRVFDLDKLASLDSEDGFQSVQEVVRSQTDFTCVSTTSEREMSSLLTTMFEKSSNFLGVKKTMKRYSQISKNSVAQQYCSYSRLTKVVASRSIDMGAVNYIIENVPADELPFTDEFGQLYHSIINAKNTNSLDGLITDMLDRYGTHIVIEANAGGMIDYVATFDRNYTSNLETVSEEQSKRVFGRTSSEVSTTVKASLISDISNSASVKACGGDATLRNNLIASIRQLNALDVIPNQALQDWFSTIYYSSANRRNLDLVDFRVFPIWELFTDNEISQRVMEKVLKMQEQSNYEIPDQELGTDNYVIPADDSRFTFTNVDDPNTSLVKIYYINKVPILEICQEYVPNIRSDRRITVLYPIYNGKTNHSQGLFIGDGEGNRPASLAFYGGRCFVTPIEDVGTTDKLANVYYIHGNLYEKDYGNACGNPHNVQVRDHRLLFNSWSVDYPVVKIGSGYWTRTYITQKMQFGVMSGRRFATKESVVDGLLFADIYQSNSSGFLLPNSSIYGQDTESYYGKQTLWYLPLTSDLNDMVEYLGGNMKMLFKGQMSGFEAQFEGYYGSYDEQGNQYSDGTKRREQGNKCYVAFKSGVTSSAGVAMVLTPDYKWNSIVTSASYNYYPVKLYRTSYFIHSNLQ